MFGTYGTYLVEQESNTIHTMRMMIYRYDNSTYWYDTYTYCILCKFLEKNAHDHCLDSPSGSDLLTFRNYQPQYFMMFTLPCCDIYCACPKVSNTQVWLISPYSPV